MIAECSGQIKDRDAGVSHYTISYRLHPLTSLFKLRFDYLCIVTKSRHVKKHISLFLFFLGLEGIKEL